MPLGRGGRLIAWGKTVHSPLFLREIVDVDRSVRPGRHWSLDASETGERTKCA